jgi:uncharacterized cupin superfamily protein
MMTGMERGRVGRVHAAGDEKDTHTHTHTHTGVGGTKKDEFDPAFAAMFEDSSGSNKADSRDHMGIGDCTAGTFRHINGSDNTCSMFKGCMHVCMFACMHAYMYV